MVREYRDKPEPGSITKRVREAPISEHSTIKVKAFLETLQTPFVFSRGLFVITVHTIWSPAPGVLGVRVTITKGVDHLPIDLEHYWVNPPVNVPDGTWHTDDETGEDFPNYIEDVVEAFKTIVIEDYVKPGLGDLWQL